MKEKLGITDLMDMQVEFERQRGLDKLNTPEYSLMRIGVELDEANTAFREGTDRELLEEVADIVIFSSSLLANIATKMDISFEEVEQVIGNKMANNQIKFDVGFFNGVAPDKAMKTAKDWWDNPPDIEGNDYY